MTQAVVLLSGGLDSVFNLYAAREKWGARGVQALTFDYGQRAFLKEQEAAHYFCESLKVPVQTIDIKALFQGDASSLTNTQVDVPTTSVDIHSHEASEKSAAQVWVANRNGIFLNIAAGLAERLNAPYIIPGFNREEAQTFPDNSVDFIEKTNQALALSTRNAVQVMCFSQDLDKTQIIGKSLHLGIDLDRIWSCYFAGETPCGKCESCQRFIRAREEN